MERINDEGLPRSGRPFSVFFLSPFDLLLLPSKPTHADELGLGIGQACKDHDPRQVVDETDPLAISHHSDEGQNDTDINEHCKRRDQEPGDAEVAQVLWFAVPVGPGPFWIVPLEQLPRVEDDGDLQVEVEADQTACKVHGFLGSRG